MLSELFGVFSDDFAIDLGTANTLVYVPGRGVVSDEPSVVALRTSDGQREVIAIGARAKAMLGRTPDGIETIRPLRDGVIADFIAAEEMLSQTIEKAQSKLKIRRPRILICVPAGSTPVERRAVYESALSTGARRVWLLEEPVAAAMGAGLPIHEPQGSMVVDIGGGTTDIAVLSLGGVMDARSIRCAGNAMDEAVIKFVRRNHQLLIGEANAELIKMEVGSAMKIANGKSVDVHIKGRDLRRGLPTEIVLGPRDIAEALTETLEDIADAIRRTLEDLPPELSSDICERGIYLTGGGALLDKLDIELSRRTGVKFYVADDPLLCVIKGCAMVLNDMPRYENLIIKPS